MSSDRRSDLVWDAATRRNRVMALKVVSAERLQVRQARGEVGFYNSIRFCLRTSERLGRIRGVCRSLCNHKRPLDTTWPRVAQLKQNKQKAL